MPCDTARESLAVPYYGSQQEPLHYSIPGACHRSYDFAVHHQFVLLCVRTTASACAKLGQLRPIHAKLETSTVGCNKALSNAGPATYVAFMSCQQSSPMAGTYLPA